MFPQTSSAKFSYPSNFLRKVLRLKEGNANTFSLKTPTFHQQNGLTYSLTDRVCVPSNFLHKVLRLEKGKANTFPLKTPTFHQKNSLTYSLKDQVCVPSNFLHKVLRLEEGGGRQRKRFLRRWLERKTV